LLDVREPATFLAGHAKGAVNVGLGGQFASWCGTLLSMDEPIVIIAGDEHKAVDAVVRLARVGMENVVGWTLAPKRASAKIPQITARSLAAAPQSVLDVRRRGEFESGHIPGATNVPLDELPQRLDEVPRNGALAVICAGGYRSSMACSLLARAGVTNLANVTGGTTAWVQEGLPTEA
jgi:rhodanese-related sulfurtransferase